MDVLSFINSNTIREHLKSIDYQFNSLETAWLIHNCHRLSYDEKKTAWLTLIKEMPDCAVPKRMNCDGRESLHEFLREYIRITDREIETFYRKEPAGTHVYMYSYLYRGDSSCTEEYATIFPSLEKCMEAFRADVASLDETYCPEGTGVVEYSLRKQSLSDPDRVMEIYCAPDEQTNCVSINTNRTEEERSVLDCSLDGLWFDFPTPFKKGDIVWVPKEPHEIRWDEDGGFVLLGLTPWDAGDFIRENGDRSDMNGYGYFVNPNGTVYREVMENYMDLEFYPGPYKLNEGILTALSMYLKDEVSLDFLLCAYRKVLLKNASDDVMLKSFFPDEWVKDAGLL